MINGSSYVLLADDDPDDRHFFCEGMRRFFPEIVIHTFQDGDELLHFLDNNPLPVLPACILLDYKMPRLTAPQVLQATGAGTRYAPIPKVVWSTSERKKDIDECLGLGAVRFVIKPDKGSQLDRLINSLGEWFGLKKPLENF
jgi:CheY-like chemotaxis protein